MDGGAVGVAVVRHHALNRDPVTAVVSDGAAEEANRGRRPLVVEHLDVRDAGRVVDRDLHELPAEVVGPPMVSATADAAGDSVARATDPADFFTST